MVEKAWMRHGNWQDMVNIILGLLLVVAPWALGYATVSPAEGVEPAVAVTSVAAISSWISGGLVALLAAAALVRTFEWEEWVTGFLGLWIVIAPWALSFASVQQAAAAHVVLGILIAALAGWDIWSVRHAPPAAKA